MTTTTTGSSSSIVWTGKPWILPAATARTILTIIVAFVIILLEYFSGTSTYSFAGINIVLWTALAFSIIWLISLSDLLVERATNNYTLRNESLEIRTGILTSRSYVVVPAGFADLEVIRGVIGRIIEYGDIIIRTQNEIQSQKILKKVRTPLKVSEQIRYIMGRPIVRIEQSMPTR
jgi:membrane protein YdbS with pleckstrin-like domain